MRKPQDQVIESLRNGFASPPEQPLVQVPQRGQQPQVIVVQPPTQPPAMTAADYALARTQLVFQHLPLLMLNPNRQFDRMLEFADDYTNSVYYDDEGSLHIED